MNSERRQRIEQLYRSAREQKPGARSAFLAQACGNDEDLCREVEALLDQGVTDALGEQTTAEALAGRSDTRTFLTPGARLGPYKIVSALGAGGMGSVYRALDTRLDRMVAIKISAAQFSARFNREARAVAALNHPNICTVHDVGPNYLVMELVDGETLAARISKGPMPVESVLRYGSQIAEALKTAHAVGVIHRDLKPANMMLTSTGIKVLDFGLAKFTSSPLGAARLDDNLTGSHMALGTPAYMAPEQALGKAVDARTDLFSFGVVLYEMATGTRPFQGANSVATMDAILHTDPVPASQLNPSIPVGLANIISRALDKNPSTRYQSAAEMLDDFKRVTDAPHALAAEAALGAVLSRAKRNWLIGALAAAIAISLLATAPIVSRWAKRDSVPEKRMIAVLPFKNLSGDVSKEYFSDGLTEDVITTLSRLEPSRLGVIARTSSMYYKTGRFALIRSGASSGSITYSKAASDMTATWFARRPN